MDVDGDGEIDALESSMEDEDVDGVVDELDAANNDPTNDTDGDGLANNVECGAPEAGDAEGVCQRIHCWLTLIRMVIVTVLLCLEGLN